VLTAATSKAARPIKQAARDRQAANEAGMMGY
jgi:hypothetical protein